MAILSAGSSQNPKSYAAQPFRNAATQALNPTHQIHEVIDQARHLAAPEARWVGQPRHVGRAITFCLDAVSRGTSLEDVQRLGRYTKDRLNAAYVRLTQRADGCTVLELPTTQSRDIYLDGNRALLSDARVMLGPLFTEQGSAILDLDDPASHHVLLVASLTERTMLLRALWYQLIRQNRPSGLRFVVIDPHATLPASIQTSAHLLCAPIQNTVDSGSPDLWHLETLQALQIVMREIHRRQHGASTQTRLIVVVTEIAELLQRKGLQHLLDQVIQQGRGVRVHVVAGTSEVRPEVLQHTLLQHHFQARLVGQMPGNADSELACGGPDYHCEWSLGNGDFTYTQSSQRFQCGIVSDGELKYLPRALGLPDVWNLSSW